MANLNDIFDTLNSVECSYPNIHNVQSETPSILKSIDNHNKIQVEKLKQITANQKLEIAGLKENNLKLQEQIDFAKQEALSAKNESKKATVLGIAGIIVSIAALGFEIVSKFLN